MMRGVLCGALVSAVVALGAGASTVLGSGRGWSAGVDTGVGVNVVSCASSSFCAGVGDGDAVIWDGRSWTRVAVDTSRTFEAVSCASASFCAAADNYGYAMIWNGHTWSTPVSIDGGTQYSTINGISCPTASFCMAVDAASGRAVIWDGTSWSAPATVDADGLDAVSCPSTSVCVAVDNAGRTLTWRGGAWSAPDDIDGAKALATVSCPSTSFCGATDRYGSALTWAGGAWSKPVDIAAPNEASVSCPSASFCVAVVDSGSEASEWNGASWSAATVATQPTNYAFGTVSCPSETFCVAFDGDTAVTYGGSLSAAATPVLARSVAAATVSGRVLVEVPGAHAFVPLTASTLIPVGSTVDATNGRVRLEIAAPHAHAVRAGQFYDGEFQLTQARSGIADLTLRGGAACAGVASKSPARPPRRQRKLWGSGHGSFATVGTDAAATDLGTRWLTQDTCSGTLIRVSEGEVRVTDLVRHTSLLLQAPHSYFAAR
jgi:hypothetical protein